MSEIESKYISLEQFCQKRDLQKLFLPDDNGCWIIAFYNAIVQSGRDPSSCLKTLSDFLTTPSDLRNEVIGDKFILKKESLTNQKFIKWLKENLKISLEEKENFYKNNLTGRYLFFAKVIVKYLPENTVEQYGHLLPGHRTSRDNLVLIEPNRSEVVTPISLFVARLRKNLYLRQDIGSETETKEIISFFIEPDTYFIVN